MGHLPFCELGPEHWMVWLLRTERNKALKSSSFEVGFLGLALWAQSRSVTVTPASAEDVLAYV